MTTEKQTAPGERHKFFGESYERCRATKNSGSTEICGQPRDAAVHAPTNDGGLGVALAELAADARLHEHRCPACEADYSIGEQHTCATFTAANREARKLHEIPLREMTDLQFASRIIEVLQGSIDGGGITFPDWALAKWIKNRRTSDHN